MAACCQDAGCSPGRPDRRGDAYWKALVWALVLNLVLFVVELLGSYRSGSVSLLADAVDFLGDAVNYGATLVVLDMALPWRSRLALGKGSVMAGWGALVLVQAVWSLFHGTVPEAHTMTAIGALALATNLLVAVLLYRHRTGDANRRAVWLCTRNDAIGNLAVLGAAQLVGFTGRGWPDLLVAVGMAVLGLWSGIAVMRQARREIPSGADRSPPLAVTTR